MDDPLSHRVIACAFEVSNTLGAGFLESVYEKALCVELRRQQLNFEAQKSVPVSYKGVRVGNYVADIVVENKLLLELKAVSVMDSVFEAQLMNYLKATGLTHGLLLNFGRPKLGIKRIIWNHNETSRKT